MSQLWPARFQSWAPIFESRLLREASSQKLMSRLSGQTYRKKIGNSSHLFCTVNAVRAFWGNLSALFQFHTKQHVRIWNTSNASAEPAKWGCSSPTLLDGHVNRGVKRQSSYQPAWSTRSRQWPEGWASRVLLAVKSKKKLNTVLFFPTQPWVQAPRTWLS